MSRLRHGYTNRTSRDGRGTVEKRYEGPDATDRAEHKVRVSLLPLGCRQTAMIDRCSGSAAYVEHFGPPDVTERCSRLRLTEGWQE